MDIDKDKKLQLEITKVRNRCRELQEMYDKNRIQLLATKAEKELLEQQVHQLTQDGKEKDRLLKETLKKQKPNLNKIQELQAKIKEFEATILEKDEQISAFKEDHNKLARDTLNKNEGLQLSNIALEEEVSRLKQELGGCNPVEPLNSLEPQDINSVNKDFDLLRNENSRQLNSIKRLEATIEKNYLFYKTEREDLEQKQKQLTEEIVYLRSLDKEAMVRKIQQLEQDVTAQKLEAANLSFQLQKYKQENSNLTQQNQAIKLEIKKAAENHESPLIEMGAKHEALQAALKKNHKHQQILETNDTQNAICDKTAALKEETCTLKQGLLNANQEIDVMSSKLAESSRLEEDNPQLENDLQHQIFFDCFEEEDRPRQLGEELEDDCDGDDRVIYQEVLLPKNTQDDVSNCPGGGDKMEVDSIEDYVRFYFNLGMIGGEASRKLMRKNSENQLTSCVITLAISVFFVLSAVAVFTCIRSNVGV